MSKIVIETADDIKTILEDPKMTLDEKLDSIVNSGSPITKFAAVMLEYEKKMSKETTLIEPNQGAANNYNLFTRLMRVLKEKDFDNFTTYFDVINMIFNKYKDDAYSEFMLHRFDMEWKWGAKELKTYQNLITLICVLCDRSTRASEIRKISLNKVLDLNKTIFTEDIANNIRRYYNP